MKALKSSSPTELDFLMGYSPNDALMAEVRSVWESTSEAQRQEDHEKMMEAIAELANEDLKIQGN